MYALLCFNRQSSLSRRHYSDKARSHCNMKPLDPRRLNHQLSDPFVDLIADMMAKDPARISTAAEVVERLVPWSS